VDLCPDCEEALPWLDSPWLHDPLAGAQCTLAPWAYAEPLATLVRDLKFAGAIPAGRVLGQLLGEARQAQGAAAPDLQILPVPLHPLRLAERGYNQAELLARQAGRVLARPVRTGLLQRLRHTAAQSGLGATDRAANLEQAFAAELGRWRGCPVAVVDDVLTTGSTLRAVVKALKADGAGPVEVWTVARTLPGTPVAALTCRWPSWPIC
jgi:ComF family protein